MPRAQARPSAWSRRSYAPKSCDALQHALALAGDAPWAHGLQWMLAEAQWNAGLATTPATPWAAGGDPVTADVLAALAALAAGQWSIAQPCLERLVEFAPRAIAARAAGWLGRARLAQGDAASARSLLADALHHEAADAEAWIAWADASLALGRATEALQGLRIAQALLPGHAELGTATRAAHAALPAASPLQVPPDAR